MAPKFALILLLPIICDAKIKIDIKVASNKHDATIKYSGGESKLVTDHEVTLFNVSTPNLNRGVRKELGRVPDGIFLKDPTPYGDLYKKYKWPQVHRSVYINKVEIEELSTKEVVLKMHDHVNNASGDSSTDRSLFVDVETTARSEWSSFGLPEEDISYDVKVNFEKGSLKYQNKWRETSLKFTYSKFGVTENKAVTVKPGQTVVKKLTALETFFVVNVYYKAELTGNVILDYEKLYGKYHFYAPLMNNIMKAVEIPNEIITREKIEIKCYTNPKLEIYDRVTGTPVTFRKARKVYFKSKKWLG